MTLLYQPNGGYCYNTDTIALFHFIIQNLKRFKNVTGDLLDIGSGSGILGILVAKYYPKLTLHSVEIQEEFIFLTKKNSTINGVTTQMIEGDFTQLQIPKRFDIVVSNPPFYPACVMKTENQNIKIARYNDSLPLEQLIQKATELLSENGKFFFCYDVKLLDDIIFFAKKYRLNIESLQFLHPKKDKNSSLVMVYGRKNSKSLLEIYPPLIAFEGEKMTDEMRAIYTLCNTHSIKVNL